jgi:hypothetical protein
VIDSYKISGQRLTDVAVTFNSNGAGTTECEIVQLKSKRAKFWGGYKLEIAFVKIQPAGNFHLGNRTTFFILFFKVKAKSDKATTTYKPRQERRE